MIDLPIDAHLPSIVDNLRQHRAIVIVAEPGAGKTTRVPPAILAANLLSPAHPNLVMLQPRRVAARASAMRIADERGWTLGEQVGYHVRFDRKIGRQTKLRVITEGILTRQLLDDPFIDEIGCVVLDEFHERNLNTDMAIAMLREVRQSVREDLMLVVMSATLDAEPVAKFLGDCPIVRVPGRTFPVAISHFHFVAPDTRLVDRVVSAIERELTEKAGLSPLQKGDSPAFADVLVFLPGADEIRRVGEAIESLAQRQNLRVLPLHGSLEAEQQMAALAPSQQRKMILATNIAETSLTIDGVTTVIDSGYARVAGYDPAAGIGSSGAEAHQQSLRDPAGRTRRAARRRGDACDCGRRRRTPSLRSLSFRKSGALTWPGPCSRCTPGENPIREPLPGMSRRMSRSSRRPSDCSRCSGRRTRKRMARSPSWGSGFWRCQCIPDWRSCSSRRRMTDCSKKERRLRRCCRRKTWRWSIAGLSCAIAFRRRRGIRICSCGWRCLPLPQRGSVLARIAGGGN